MKKTWKSICLRLLGLVALIVIGATFILWWLITQPLVVEVGGNAQSPPVDPERLRAQCEILANGFLPRDWKHPGNLDAAAAYIYREFGKVGAEVREQAYEMEGEVYRNVIARFGPADGELVVIGALYDAFGPFPGADDNISGVAGLIELSRLLGQAPPRVPVELVAYTLEEPREAGEPGLFRSEYGGSAQYARELVSHGAQVKVALVFDMIGYFIDEPGSQDLPVGFLQSFYPSRGNFIAVIGKLGQGHVVRKVKGAMRAGSELPVFSLNGPESLEGVDWSDHLNYWNAGYPAVLITDTSFYRNKNYHTPNDTTDRLDYDRLAMVVEGPYAAILAFGG